jgi:hypothetical protein
VPQIVRRAGGRTARQSLFKEVLRQAASTTPPSVIPNPTTTTVCAIPSCSKAIAPASNCTPARAQAATARAGARPALTAAINAACDTKFDSNQPPAMITDAVTRCGTYANNDRANALIG